MTKSVTMLWSQLCAWRAGGTFALYSLLCRHIGILPGSRQSAAPDPADVLLSAYSSVSELGAPAGPKPCRRTIGAHIREGIKRSAFAQSVRRMRGLLCGAGLGGRGLLW